MPGVRVSIPIGFSHQLRLDRPGGHTADLLRFNPYRVFSSAETAARQINDPFSERFQSLSVFSSAETVAELGEDRRR
mgnify:FL=1